MNPSFARLASLSTQSDWPQWRGVDGTGVSSETGLPTRLGADSPELLWRVEVPGEGVSSPIVKSERVFLTTSYPNDPEASTVAVRYGLPLVAVLALVLLFVRRPRREESPERLVRFVAGLDGLLAWLGTLALPAVVWVFAFHSGWLWEPGSPGYRWVYTGLLALSGTVVALAWLRTGSLLRLIGIAALCLAAWEMFQRVPTNMYRKEFRLEIRLAMIAPAIVGALWQLVVLALARPALAPRGSSVRGLGALSVLVAAWGTFLLANFLTPAAGVERALACFDLATGERRWLTPLFVGPEEKKYAENSYATPTPCATDALVFAHFGSGYGAVDHDGRKLWVEEDEDFHLETRYGASASPVLLDDTVLYLHDKESGLGPSYVTRIELATGKTLWYRETEETHDSYMTPLVVARGGERELVAVTCDWIVGYSLEDGERLWKLETPIEQMVPGIQHRGDLLLVSGGTHAGFETCGVRLSGHGKRTTGEVLWRTRRAVPGVSSPVWVGDGFYTITDGGIVTCYEPETGTVRWQERVEGKFWASLVAGDGKIYALSHEGVLTTLEAGPEFKVLAQGEFGSTCRATPAIASGRVLVRTEHELFCFGTRP
jgi:hypothetical protein